MKNGKKPTLAQKKFLQDTGLDSEKWLIVKDTQRRWSLSAELPCRGGVEKQRLSERRRNEREIRC